MSRLMPRSRSTNKRAVEVIHLVLKRAGEQALALPLILGAGAIQALDDDARGTHDGGVELRDAQAAFVFELHAVAFDERRIDHDHQAVRLAADREIDDEDAQRHADLRRRQPDARRGVHRFDHVVDQSIDVGRQLANRLRLL